MDIKWPISGQVYVTILHTQYVCPEENFITNQNIHIFAIVCVVVVSTSKYPVVVERLTVTDKEGSSHAYVSTNTSTVVLFLMSLLYIHLSPT